MRKITEDEVRHYKEHGVVYLPDLLEESWLTDMEGAFAEAMGDAIVHHVRTVHGSTGNTSKRDRRSFTLRFVGDDVRYLEREGAPSDSQKSDALEDGDLMDGDEFPLIWSTDQGYVSV